MTTVINFFSYLKSNNSITSLSDEPVALSGADACDRTLWPNTRAIDAVGEAVSSTEGLRPPDQAPDQGFINGASSTSSTTDPDLRPNKEQCAAGALKSLKFPLHSEYQ